MSERWSEKEIKDLQESMKKLKGVINPPKKIEDYLDGADFLKDLLNMKEKK